MDQDSEEPRILPLSRHIRGLKCRKEYTSEYVDPNLGILYVGWSASPHSCPHTSTYGTILTLVSCDLLRCSQYSACLRELFYCRRVPKTR